jgi:zinc transport system substrate-binding protein
MKKTIAIIIAASVLLTLAACAKKPPDDGKLHVVVTTDALYELVSIVGGDRVSVTNISNGAEPHDFEPKPRDIAAIQSSGLFVYNGLGLDTWADELDVPNKCEATWFAAMLSSTWPMDDPHMWLSPFSVCLMASSICTKLKELEPENEELFKANFKAFEAEMNALREEFGPKFDAAPNKTFVTGHAALGYLAQNFGLEQKSVEDVFASGEPTAKQLAELADYCNANGIKTILAEEAASKAVSETLARECGAQIAIIYTMERAEDGLGFAERMRRNLETVLSALG